MTENNGRSSFSSSKSNKSRHSSMPMSSDRLYNAGHGHLHDSDPTGGLISPPPEETLQMQRTSTSNTNNSATSKRKRPVPQQPQQSTPNPKPRKQSKSRPSNTSYLDSPTRPPRSPAPSNPQADFLPSRTRRTTPIPAYEPPTDVFTPPRVVILTPLAVPKSSKRKTPASKPKGKKRASTAELFIKTEPPVIDLSAPMAPPSPTDDPILLSGFSSSPVRPRQLRDAGVNTTPPRPRISNSLPPSSSPTDGPFPWAPPSVLSSSPTNAPHPIFTQPIIDNITDWSSPPRPASASTPDSETEEGEYTGRFRTLAVRTKLDPPSSATRERMEEWGRPITPFPYAKKIGRLSLLPEEGDVEMHDDDMDEGEGQKTPTRRVTFAQTHEHVLAPFEFDTSYEEPLAAPSDDDDDNDEEEERQVREMSLPLEDQADHEPATPTPTTRGAFDFDASFEDPAPQEEERDEVILPEPAQEGDAYMEPAEDYGPDDDDEDEDDEDEVIPEPEQADDAYMQAEEGEKSFEDNDQVFSEPEQADDAYMEEPHGEVDASLEEQDQSITIEEQDQDQSMTTEEEPSFEEAELASALEKEQEQDQSMTTDEEPSYEEPSFSQAADEQADKQDQDQSITTQPEDQDQSMATDDEPHTHEDEDNDEREVREMSLSAADSEEEEEKEEPGMLFATPAPSRPTAFPEFQTPAPAPAAQHPTEAEDDAGDDSEDEDLDDGVVKITSADPRAAARAAAILKQHDYDCYTKLSFRLSRSRHSLAGSGVTKASGSKDERRRKSMGMGAAVVGDTVYIPGSPATTLPALLREAESSVSMSVSASRAFSPAPDSSLGLGLGLGFSTPGPASYASPRTTLARSLFEGGKEQQQGEWTKDHWKLLDACFTDERLSLGGGDVLAPVDAVRPGDVVARFIGMMREGTLRAWDSVESIQGANANGTRDALAQRVKALQNKQRRGNVAPPTTPYTPRPSASSSFTFAPNGGVDTPTPSFTSSRRMPSMEVPDFTPLRAVPLRPVGKGAPFSDLPQEEPEWVDKAKKRRLPMSLLAPRYSHLLEEAVAVSRGVEVPSHTDADAEDVDVEEDVDVDVDVEEGGEKHHEQGTEEDAQDPEHNEEAEEPTPAPYDPANTPPPIPRTLKKRVTSLLFSYLPSSSRPPSTLKPKSASAPSKPGLPPPPPPQARGPISTPARAPLPKPTHPKELVQLHHLPLPAPKASMIPKIQRPRRMVELQRVSPPPSPGKREGRGKEEVRPRRSSGGSVKDLVKGFEEMRKVEEGKRELKKVRSVGEWRKTAGLVAPSGGAGAKPGWRP
ncbi:hypothetical protein DXG01_001173 [Tephrocybe rancida]|nr:hypothetical protein DXG01_001173 [Tephrocybe rancida]